MSLLKNLRKEIKDSSLFALIGKKDQGNLQVIFYLIAKPK